MFIFLQRYEKKSKIKNFKKSIIFEKKIVPLQRFFNNKTITNE